MLIAIAANNAPRRRALLYYLIPYSAMSVACSPSGRARAGAEPAGDDPEPGGFGWERPLLGGGMTVFMLGFAGFPLTGGFVGKFYLFSAAYDRGWTWLVIVGVVATAVSLYYYLGVIRAMYFRPSEELQLAPVAGGSPPRELLLQSAVAAAIAVTVGSFFAVEPLIEAAKHATEALFL
jgi:NADH-quinone oxidoreductase subunit N